MLIENAHAREFRAHVRIRVHVRVHVLLFHVPEAKCRRLPVCLVAPIQRCVIDFGFEWNCLVE